MLSPRDKIIKAKISPLTVFNTELESSQQSKEGEKGSCFSEQEVHLSFSADGMIPYIENTKGSAKTY